MSRAAREERYTIVSELGRGGMGVVSRAFDAVRGEEVALKRLAIERFETPQDRERATALFEREYHTLSQLAHPNVISVYDYGVDEHGPYYTMEHLRGESLRARTPLPWREAASVLRDIASALAIVHSRRLVHRDVTPQNIYCGTDGGAKLIDFGAMMPMGIAKQIVGTPPFMAPECIESQPLDGQTDLFALGASLYYAISGRTAYEARSIAQLAAAWQRRPPPLSQLVPGVPESLDALVESLLGLSPASRPRTAADVYERLTSIANLPRSESSSVIRAYLTRPALIGRDRELAYLRRRAHRAFRGRGASVVLTGPAGIGRTRLLDAAVLEARLAGFVIARADASDARNPLGVIARVISSLRESGELGEPELARFGLPLHLASASDVLLAPKRRESTLRDLARVVLELARERPVAIAADDLHMLDEPSLAVLASLAAQADGKRLWLVTSLVSRPLDSASTALRLLWNSSRHLALQPMAPGAGRALLASVFGEATPNLDLFSALAERRCHGNARHWMESAQAAIDAGLARYSGAGWALTNDARAIAETLDRLTDIEHQIATLSADALELLQALSLVRESALDLADYPALTAHRESARMHRALTELSDAGWLVVDGDRARFLRDDQQARVAACIPPELARTFHSRLARCCAKPELAPVYETYHWLKAGHLERALAPMAAMNRFVDSNPAADAVRSPLAIETLQSFSEMEGIPGAHPGSRANYTAALIVNASYQGYPEQVVALIPHALREIARYTGVSDYAALPDVPASERLHRALTLANERCQAPGLGGLDLIGFIRRQTALCITTGACAVFMADPDLLSELPDLTPFAPLSPALGVAQQLIDGLSKLARGQTWLAWDAFLSVHAALPEHASAIDGLTLLALRTPLLGYLGAIEAEHAAPATLEHLDEYAPLMGHNAQSLRARYHYASGDLANWANARQQSELLSVQSKSLRESRHTEAAAYAVLFALADDLLGLRRVHAEIANLAKTRPGWRHREAIARCQILRYENRLTEALAVAESELTRLPVPHPDYVAAAATQLDVLLALQRYEAVRSAAEAHLARARAAELPAFRIELALARACAALGDHDAAERLYADAVQALETRGTRGLQLGRAFETGAYLAIGRGDAQAFEARATRCAEHYAIKQNPTLGARFGQLVREATRAGLVANRAAGEAPDSELALRTIAASAEDSAFYSAALDHLVKQSGVLGGCLYVRAREGLRCVARSENVTWSDVANVDEAAYQFYARYVGEAQSEPDGATKLATTSASTLGSADFTLWPFPIAQTSGGRRAIEGVVVFVANAASGVGIAGSSLKDLASLMTRRVAATALAPEDISTTQ